MPFRRGGGTATGRVRLPQERRSKYGAVKTTVDGITFHSAKEARRYQELLLLGKAGEIRELELQPRFSLMVERNDWRDFFPIHLGEYRADFQYWERERWLVGQPQQAESWKLVVEDVKGFKTPLYRWKKRHVEAQYGIQIREI